jgi:uncharacterized sulfatase
MRPTAAVALFRAVLCALLVPTPAGAQDAPIRPNILWITSEDNGPHLGCYGDAYATTPHLDALAAKGVIYLRCWSNAPVCAPARTAIISGVYPTSTGSEHMRSGVPMPPFMRMYPQILREAGYYCINNSKEDYNLEKPGKVWDESSARAHWKNRKAGQPFFAVFNHVVSHESQIRKRPHMPVHDPAKVRVPAYHPDTPEVRQDWAQYYDKLTEMDALAGNNLRALEEAGLAEDTIVFYYGDHGPGMPRCKRSACNSGLQVPLIVYVPPKFKHLAPKDYAPGGRSARLVGFVDLAPTVLSLAGVKPPEWMQGRTFMGPHEAEPNRYLYGFRGRMDERVDMVRSVTDGRYVYVRNFLPQIPAGQHNAYMFQTPTTRVWKKLFDEGKLTPQQAQYWQAPRRPEELYDLQTDPDEVNTLAAMPRHSGRLERLRKECLAHAIATRDVEFLPEAEFHRRAKGSTPYEMAQDPKRYDVRAAVLTASLAGSEMDKPPRISPKSLKDPDAAVRYWTAVAVLLHGKEGVAQLGPRLVEALRDESPSVRVVAAEALGRYATDEECRQALAVLVDLADVRRNGVYVAIEALNALDALDRRALPVKDRIAALPRSDPSVMEKMKENIPNLIDAILADLQ